MKVKYNISTLILSCMATFASCDKAMDENFPADFDAVMSLKTYGEQDVKLINTGENGIYKFTVLKGGNNPIKETSAELVSMTQEELEAYNLEVGTEFKLLGSDYYKFDKNINFTSADTYKEVSIELFTTSIASSLENSGSQYVLPLKLISDADSVNSNLDLLIIKPDIHTPIVTFTEQDTRKVIMSTQAATTTVTEEVDLLFDVDNNWNFTTEIETDHSVLQQYVDEYNENNLSSFPLLEAGHYEITGGSFVQGEILSSFSITIDRSELEIGGYLLPVKLKSCGDNVPFETQEKPFYILVQITGELPQVPLTKDMLYVSSWCKWDTANQWKEDKLCDGITSGNTSFWISSWGDGRDETGIDYVETDPKYGIYIDVKQNDKPIEQFKFVYWTRDVRPDLCPKTIEVYAGTSEADLQLIETLSDLPNTISLKWESENMFFGRKCSLIRIAIIDSYNWTDFRKNVRANRGVTLAEIAVYGK